MRARSCRPPQRIIQILPVGPAIDQDDTLLRMPALAASLDRVGVGFVVYPEDRETLDARQDGKRGDVTGRPERPCRPQAELPRAHAAFDALSDMETVRNGFVGVQLDRGSGRRAAEFW